MSGYIRHLVTFFGKSAVTHIKLKDFFKNLREPFRHMSPFLNREAHYYLHLSPGEPF